MPRVVHDPGNIVAHLAAALGLGANSLTDIAVLRGQPDLAGQWRRIRWCPAGQVPSAELANGADITAAITRLHAIPSS